MEKIYRFNPIISKSVEVFERNGKKVIKVKGFASTMDKDRHGDIILPTAFDDGLTDYLANSVILLQHKADKPVGVATVLESRPDGLYIEADITQNTDGCMDQIEEGILKGFSIGFNVPDGGYDFENQIITKLKLLEISIVSIPSNPKTLMKSLEFAISEMEKINKHADGGCANPDDCPDCEECAEKRAKKKEELDAQMASLPSTGEAISTENAQVVEDCGCDAEPEVAGDGVAIETSAEIADPVTPVEVPVKEVPVVEEESAENAQVEKFYELVAKSISTLSERSIETEKSISPMEIRMKSLETENESLKNEIATLKSLEGRFSAIEKALSMKTQSGSLANVRSVKNDAEISFASGARLLSK